MKTKDAAPTAKKVYSFRLPPDLVDELKSLLSDGQDLTAGVTEAITSHINKPRKEVNADHEDHRKRR